MRIALGQFSVQRDKAINGQRMEEFAVRAARLGAELILFPEGAMADYDSHQHLTLGAEPLDGPFVASLSRAARQRPDRRRWGA